MRGSVSSGDTSLPGKRNTTTQKYPKTQATLMGEKVVNVACFVTWGGLFLLHLDQRSHSLRGSFPPPPSPLVSGHGGPLPWAGPDGKRNPVVGQRNPFDVHGAPTQSSCHGNRCPRWLLLKEISKTDQSSNQKLRGKKRFVDLTIRIG